MSSFLRQATASQSRSTPPFLDDTDFKTAESGLTIANTDVKIVVNGGASADKNSGGGTHRANGVYGLTFDATDTATVGEFLVSIKVAGALPVFMTFWVLEEAVYDALFVASALGYVANAPVNVAQLSGDVAAADNAEAFFDGTGYAGTGNVIPAVTTLTGHTAQTGDAFARLGALGAGLTAVPWNAAWDAEVQSEVQDALDGIIADSVPADGTRPSISQGVYMITQFLIERIVAGTTMTVRKPDGSTALLTLTLNDATSPTSITRAT